MTNEQLAVLLSYLRGRLDDEIDRLEETLIEAGMEQHTDQAHVAEFGETCTRVPGWFGGFGTCINNDHYANVPMGRVACLDELRLIVSDLGAQVVMLQSQREQADV